MRKVGWAERQVRRADRFQQRHVVLAFPWAVVQKFGNDQAGGKAALMAYYGLFALFPLLLLATILGFALSGDPALFLFLRMWKRSLIPTRASRELREDWSLQACL